MVLVSHTPEGVVPPVLSARADPRPELSALKQADRFFRKFGRFEAVVSFQRRFYAVRAFIRFKRARDYDRKSHVVCDLL